jgi:hypothetical protein
MARWFNAVPLPATPLVGHATPNTENENLALRGGARNSDLVAVTVGGRAAAATTLSGLEFRVRRWTTVGSGGTSVPANPARVGDTPVGTVFDSESAITPGTVSGVYQLNIFCGAAGPGGWVARDPDAYICIEGGSNDELAFYSVCGVASPLLGIGIAFVE